MRYNKTLIQKAINHPGREFFSRLICSGQSTRCYLGVDLDGDGFAEVVEVYRVTYLYGGHGLKHLEYKPIEKIKVKEV